MGERKKEIEDAIINYVITALRKPSSEYKVELVPELLKSLHDIMCVL